MRKLVMALMLIGLTAGGCVRYFSETLKIRDNPHNTEIENIRQTIIDTAHKELPTFKGADRPTITIYYDNNGHDAEIDVWFRTINGKTEIQFGSLFVSPEFKAFPQKVKEALEREYGIKAR